MKKRMSYFELCKLLTLNTNNSSVINLKSPNFKRLLANELINNDQRKKKIENSQK